MAGLFAKVEEIGATVETTVQELGASVGAAEAEIEAFAPDVTPLAGFGGAARAAKDDVASQVETLIAELTAMAE